MKCKRVFLFISIVMLIPASLIQAQTIQVVTEDWPPFNYMEEGKIKGLSTEIVRQTLDQAGLSYEIALYPWARAFHMASEGENVLIYTITRTPEREDRFFWIGPFAERVIHLFSLKNREDIQINSIDDIQKYRVGVMQNDAVHEFFKEKGFQEGMHFQVVSNEEQNMRKLFAGRIDLLPGNALSLAFKFKKMGLPFQKTEKKFKLIDKGGYYMAFGKKTPEKTVKKVENSFQALQEKGIIRETEEKYLK